jgi:glucose/arabinose dehydrogenase
MTNTVRFRSLSFPVGKSFNRLLGILAVTGSLLTGCRPADGIADDRVEADRDRNELAIAMSAVPAQFSDVQLVSGMASPTAMEFAPDGRLFICEKGGALRIYKNGALLSTPFLAVSVDGQGERGLLGVAFDPNFSTEKYVYIYYTPSGAGHNRVSRFTVSASNPDVAQAGSETILLDLNPLSAVIHNGGAIHFGADGKLYIAVGENSVPANAQSMTTLLGKMLRINKDGSIPTDNPFYSTATGSNRAIWTLGHRNPFTFAIQPGTGRIFENDVGQDTWEEINDITKGSNYGWPTTEGATSDSRFKTPFLTYGHSEGCAIIGGAFYNPSVQQFPNSYVGDYFYGDYCQGWIKGLDLGTKAVSTFATGISSLVDIKVGPEGALYYVSINGTLNRISYTGGLAPTLSVQPSDKLVSVGYDATFSISANGTAPLSYQWQRNGANIPGATSSSYTLANAQMTDNDAAFRCIVSNGSGSATSNAAVLKVTTNKPPVPVILAPVAGATYTGGMVLGFSGSASDPEDGNLAPASLTWQVDFHHDTHAHPILAPTSGMASGSVTVPNRGETSSNVWFRVYLTATDANGLTTRIYQDVQPQKASITLATAPAGLQIKLDGAAVTTPYTFTGVVGIIRSIEAVSPQTLGGSTYSFASWSDGQSALHEIATPASNAGYTATFASIGTAIAIPGRLQAEDYKSGGEGVGYHDLTAGNTGAVYRTEDVDIQASTDVGGGYNIGWTQAGEWLSYGINVAASGSYTVSARMASATAGTKTIALSVDGGAATNFSFTDASGWQSWKDVAVNGVKLSAGNHTLRITMITGDFNLNYVDFVAVPNQAPTANAGVDRTVTVNSAVTLDGRASSDPDGGPQPLTYAWTQISGPAVALANANASQPSFTPSETGAYAFRLTVSDGSASSTDDIAVTVNSAPVGIALPGRIQAEDYKAGGEGVGYHDLTAGNTGAVYRAEDVDIQASTDAGGGYNVGWTQAGEWLAYDVSVAAAGTYAFTARIASGTAGTKTMTVTVDGATVATFTTTDATGWQSWKDYVANVNLTAGPHALRINMATANFNLNYLDVAAKANAAPVANAGADRDVTVNTAVTLDGRGSSDPDNGPQPLTYSWTQVSGPSVTLSNASTSQPGFTPSATGAYVFRLSVNDGAASGTDDVSITVNPAPVGIALPGRIQAEDYKAGGEGVGYHDLTAGNTGAVYRTEGVDIQATTDAGGGFNVGWTQAGEWLAFDVSVATAGSYTFTARMASANAGTKTAVVSVDGVNVATFSFTDASGWQSWKNVAVSGVNLSAGNHALRIAMNTADFNLNYLDVTKP